MTERTFDLFKGLGKLSRKDRDYFNSLSEQEQKEFLPLIIMRWLSGTQDARQVMFLNEFANPAIFSLHKHKKLLSNLLIACTSGTSQKYTWLRAKGKKSSLTPTCVKVVSQFYGYNHRHALEAIPLLAEADIIEHAEHLGYQSDEIAKVKKELTALRKKE